MINRISVKPEKALREALDSVTSIGADEIPSSLVGLDEQELAEVLSLALVVTAYVLIDACGAQWPVKSSLQRISETLATTSSNARRLHLDSGEVYDYPSRTVFGKDRLEDVVRGEPTFTRLPMVVANEALAVYSKDLGRWDYLDRAEAGIEEASALDPMVIPGAVMRAYMKEAE